MAIRHIPHYFIYNTLFCQAFDIMARVGYTRAMSQTTRHQPEPAAAPASCPGLSARAASAFSLLQEKWTLFIVSALLHGPAGFNEMSRNAGRINSTTLAQRLILLEQAGLVRKTVQSTMPPRTSYALTEAGRALDPIVEAIAAWGERYLPDHTPPCNE